MIKSIIKGLGAALTTVGEIASEIKKSTAFKAFRFAVSATVGLPLAVVATALTSVAWAGIKAASIFETKVIPSVFGAQLWKPHDWDAALQGTEKFMTSIWEDFGVYPHLKVAKFIGDGWAKRQSETGLGDTADDPKNPANHYSLDNVEKQEEVSVNQVIKVDESSLQVTKVDKSSPKVNTPSSIIKLLSSKNFLSNVRHNRSN